MLHVSLPCTRDTFVSACKCLYVVFVWVKKSLLFTLVILGVENSTWLTDDEKERSRVEHGTQPACFLFFGRGRCADDCSNNRSYARSHSSTSLFFGSCKWIFDRKDCCHMFEERGIDNGMGKFCEHGRVLNVTSGSTASHHREPLGIVTTHCSAVREFNIKIFLLTQGMAHMTNDKEVIFADTNIYAESVTSLWWNCAGKCCWIFFVGLWWSWWWRWTSLVGLFTYQADDSSFKF